MTKTALLASAAALALSAGNALAATPSAVAHGTPHRVVSVTPGSVTLYDQTSATLGNAISSQHFSSGGFSSAYDDQAADDFVVPSGKWIIKEIDVNGVNFGTHAAAYVRQCRPIVVMHTRCSVPWSNGLEIRGNSRNAWGNRLASS